MALVSAGSVNTPKPKQQERPFGNRLPWRTRRMRQASRVGCVRWGEQCGAVWLVTEAGGV